MEAVFCSIQRDSETERYESEVLNLAFMATLVWHNFGCQPGCPRDTKKDTFCTHFEPLGPV